MRAIAVSMQTARRAAFGAGQLHPARSRLRVARTSLYVHKRSQAGAYQGLDISEHPSYHVRTSERRFVRRSIAMTTTPHTVPLTPAAQFSATFRSWRNGLRPRQHSPLDRFADMEMRNSPQTVPLLTHFAPITKPGFSAAVPCTGRGPYIVHVSGRWRGCVAFEASDNGARWESVELVAFSSDITARETARPGMWRLPSGFTKNFFRINAHTLTAGAVTGVIAASPLPVEQYVCLFHAA